MTAVLLLFAKLGPLVAGVLPYLSRALNGGATVAAAAIGAIPGVLDAVSKSPLLAFLLACAIAWPVGVGYGLAKDMELRAAQRKAGIERANRDAATAIAREKAAFDRRLAAVCVKLPAKQRPKECGA